MTRSEMLAELRRVLGDSVSPYYWSDTVLLQYMAEGQDKFCEDTGYFVDTTTYSITLATDTNAYSISDRIFQVYDVYYGTQKLERYSNDDVLEERTLTGQPIIWWSDEATGYIHVYPTPTSDYDSETLTLRVWRYSTEFLSDTDAEPELPSRFHLACVEYAAYKAFNRHDADRQDQIKASDHLRAYAEYVSDGRRAVRRIHNSEVRVGGSLTYVV